MCVAPDDQAAVIDALLEGVATNWIAIGLFLGIPYNRIEMFQEEGDLEGRINKMVAFWLGGRCDTEQFGEPTWRKLVDAVAARSGGCHQRLAAEIAKNHPLGTAKVWKESATLCSSFFLQLQKTLHHPLHQVRILYNYTRIITIIFVFSIPQATCFSTPQATC